MQTVKRLINQSEDPYLALLSYRTTPFPWCNLSPAQLLMGRQPRSNIPQTEDQLTPTWQYLEKFRQDNEEFKQKQKRDFNRRHNVRPLPPIPNDSDVWITSGENVTPGRVISTAHAPRSYIVETSQSNTRRNRKHLNIVPNSSDESPIKKIVETPRRILTRTQTGTIIRPPTRLWLLFKEREMWCNSY